MGQGYSINVSAGSAGIDVPELSDLILETSLGAARFVKTVRARHKDGLVVAKVFTKPYPNLKLDKYSERLLAERRLLAEVPNALAYHRILETATNGFLVRQFIHSSLCDRISTNPSLEEIEKKWIAFQLLCAVRDCHDREIYHGDIKAENMLVTSWNWLYLTDFASSFKPARLPEDNPATFSQFFDTTGRRICYIAPERFVSSAELKEHEIVEKMEEEDRKACERWHSVTWTMDIFSVGCVIAELFTEKPTFTLHQLLSYRKGDYDPTHTTLNNIKDDQIREMVGHMIQLDSEKRYTAAEYLEFYKDKVFPFYFEAFLHQYMHVITDPTSGRTPVVVGEKNNGGSDDRIERIYTDFGSIAFSLGFANDVNKNHASRPRISAGLDLFPLQIDLPNDRHQATDLSNRTSDNGALLFLDVVIASLRTTARASSKIRACELLLALAERLTDEAKLDRVLPFAIDLLEDPSQNVAIAALRTVTQLLAIVTVLSPMNVLIFPNYVLRMLRKFISREDFKQSPPLRATYATCLASLVTTASGFLDMMQALRADGSLPSTDPEAEDDVAAYAAYQESYDSTREDLIRHFEAQTKIFVTDPDPSVRRAFLGSVADLCVFFGDSLSADLILTHLNTYVSDPDWTLKCAFYEAIVGVAAFIGGASLEQFILPLMIQALTDSEESVTEQVIRSLSSMARLGLFERWTIVELVLMITRFTLHPNIWIREAAVQFIEAASTHMSDADSWSMIMPLIRPVLKIPSSELSELSLLDALKKPFPRSALDMAKTWAEKVDKGLFWRPSQQNKSPAFELASGKALVDFYQDLNTRPLSKTNKNEEDEKWLSTLRLAGMRTEDEPKLLALRDYIWRLMLRVDKDASTLPFSPYSQVVSLAELQIDLQNVVFNDEPVVENHPKQAPAQQPAKVERKLPSVEDALWDGTTPAQTSAGGVANTKQPPQNVAGGTANRSTADQDTGYPSVDDKVISHRRRIVNLDNHGILSSSPTSIMSVGSRGHNHNLSHKSSAMNLLKRAETVKATAETGTDSVNAVGRLDAPSHDNSQRSTPRPSTRLEAPPLNRAPPSHGYTGGDPTVLKLLENVQATTINLDSDFGRRIQVARRPLGTQNNTWKPKGQLVAVLGEHSGQINCIAVAPDHAFFITGSDDGTVRIWDTSRFERNVTHRSRHAYKHGKDDAGVRITSLAFIEQTYSFVSTGSDGSVHVVKVDLEDGAGSPRYGKLQVMREWVIPSQDDRTEYAVSVDHSRAEGQSLIMILTNLCRVLAVDPQSMSIVYELQNPVQHGAPTTFCIQRRRQWLVIGTSHGVLDLWDLRFRLRLRSWTVRKPSPISRISLHPGRRSNQKQKICVAGFTDPGHVSIWDLEKAVCSEIYHVIPESDISTLKLNARDFELINVDEEKSSASVSTRILGAVSLDTNLSPQANETPSKRGTAPGAIRTFSLMMHIPPDGSDSRYHYLVSAGPDWKIRFWDSSRLENSGVINGHDAKDESAAPLFLANMLGNDTRVFTARDNMSTPSASDKGKAKESPGSSPSHSPSPKPGTGGRMESASKSDGASVSSGGSREKKKREGREGKISRYDKIRASAQQLLRGHKDSVTAVMVVEKPFGMLVSGDRSGTVYVFM